MSTGREIRSYDYVNRPYERVRDALRENALTVFQSATKAAASRAHRNVRRVSLLMVGAIGFEPMTSTV
jgi:hypothetical protein